MLGYRRSMASCLRSPGGGQVCLLAGLLVVVTCLVLQSTCVAAIPPDYDQKDGEKLVAFLNSKNGSTTNGKVLNPSYDENTPSTWTGVVWDTQSPKRVREIQWVNKGLVGSLDVSELAALFSLQCDQNELTEIDVSDCPALASLQCEDNSLTDLTVSGCSSLKSLHCYGNKLTDLDLSGLSALETLHCYSNQLETLSPSGCSALKEIKAWTNSLESLDLSGRPQLTSVECYDNSLTSLVLTGCTALTYLDCRDNQLTELSVTGFAALKELYCSENLLADLDVTGCTELNWLNCGSNQLSGLDVSACTKLERLYCGDNQLSFIDITGCVGLMNFDCSKNQLQELDVSGYTGLKYLSCFDNELTSLNTTGCSGLTTLSCHRNLLTFSSLPERLPQYAASYSYAPQDPIPIGSEGFVGVGDTVDLSAEASVAGTVFKWYHGGTVITPTETGAGKFTFDESFKGKKVYCQLTNTTEFPGLTLQTVLVEIGLAPQHKITFIKPTAANDATNPVTINSGSLVIAMIDGDMGEVVSLTASVDGGTEEAVALAGQAAYYLLPPGLTDDEHTVTIRLVNTASQEISASVTFHWVSYRTGFGFGRYDFGDADTH